MTQCGHQAKHSFCHKLLKSMARAFLQGELLDFPK
nr:MAG TPA: hypothetical protein [Caudoviricetes sp.]